MDKEILIQNFDSNMGYFGENWTKSKIPFIKLTNSVKCKIPKTEILTLKPNEYVSGMISSTTKALPVQVNITGKFIKYKFLIAYNYIPSFNHYDFMFQDRDDFIIRDDHEGNVDFKSKNSKKFFSLKDKFSNVQCVRFTLMAESHFKGFFTCEFMADFKRVDIEDDKNLKRKDLKDFSKFLDIPLYFPKRLKEARNNQSIVQENLRKVRFYDPKSLKEKYRKKVIALNFKIKQAKMRKVAFDEEEREKAIKQVNKFAIRERKVSFFI